MARQADRLAIVGLLCLHQYQKSQSILNRQIGLSFKFVESSMVNHKFQVGESWCFSLALNGILDFGVAFVFQSFLNCGKGGCHKQFGVGHLTQVFYD